METLSQFDQWFVRIPDASFHEKYAHDYCGRLWWKLGLWMFVPSVLIHIPFYHSTEDQIGTVAMILVIVQCIVLIASIIPTEHALKKTFDRNGNRI